MHNRSDARITISGPLPAGALAQLAAAIVQDRAGTQYGQPFESEAAAEAHIRSCAQDEEPLHLCRAEAILGQLPAIADACQAIGLSYLRSDDGDYESDPSAEFWEPGLDEPISWPCGAGGTEIYLAAQEIRRFLDNGTLPAELDRMDRARSTRAAAITIS